MPNFICPNCGNRSISQDRTAGFRDRPRGCTNCGFGFLFELLDDYYPAPNAAFVVTDADARVIGSGRGVRELTGLGETEMIGQPVREVLGLQFENGSDHVGVSEAGELARSSARPDHAALGVADEEGGVGRRVVVVEHLEHKPESTARAALRPL